MDGIASDAVVHKGPGNVDADSQTSFERDEDASRSHILVPVDSWHTSRDEGGSKDVDVGRDNKASLRKHIRGGRRQPDGAFPS